MLVDCSAEAHSEGTHSCHLSLTSHMLSASKSCGAYPAIVKIFNQQLSVGTDQSATRLGLE